MLVYKYFERRKRRKLYWNIETQPKVKVSRNDFATTAMYNAVKEEFESEDETNTTRENVVLTLDKSKGKKHILKKK